MPKTNYIDIMEKNHMEIPWHDYTNADSNALIADADLIEKASVIGRVDYAFVWYWCVACAYIYEQTFQGAWRNLYC